MKNIAFSILVLLSSVEMQAQHVNPNGPFRIFFPGSDKVYLEGAFKDSLPDGVWKFYYLDKPNYYMVNSYTYAGGLLNGEHKSFHMNGATYDSGHYVNNRKQGTWKRCSYKGEVFEVKTYRNDTLHGYFQYADDSKGKGHYANGKMDGEIVFREQYSNNMVYARYKKDIRDGRWVTLKTMKGKNDVKYEIKEVMTYVNDTLHGPFYSFFLPDSMPIENGTYKKGRLEGPHTRKTYKDLSNPKMGFYLQEKNYLNGRLYDMERETFPNGKVHRELYYNTNERNGRSFEWDTNGMLKRISFSKSNSSYDSTKTWHPNGQLRSESVRDGNRIGQYNKSWDLNGNLIYRDSFYRIGKDSVYDSYAYDKNHVIEHEYHFINGKRTGRWYNQGEFHLYYKNGLVIRRIKPALPDEDYDHYVDSYFGRNDRDGDISSDDHAFNHGTYRRSDLPSSKRTWFVHSVKDTQRIAKWIRHTQEMDSLNLKGDVVYKCYINLDGLLCCPVLVKGLHPAYNAEALRVIFAISNSHIDGTVDPEWVYVTIHF